MKAEEDGPRAAPWRLNERNLICGGCPSIGVPVPGGRGSAEPGGGARQRCRRRRLDPATGEVLPSWDGALDAIGDEDEPLRVARFGDRFDAQGVIAGSRDANRCIGYLTKNLTKHVADCHHVETSDQVLHVDTRYTGPQGPGAADGGLRPALTTGPLGAQRPAYQ
jgi:hypothetical protein